MANSYKDIIITPNRGNTADPKIEFRGGNTTVNTAITVQTYPTSNGTLSFEGTAGQLFSVTNDLTGSIFSVNDVSGIPSIEVFANGQINFAQYGGNIVVGTGVGLNANGSYGSTGQALVSNGSSVFWSSNPGYTGSVGPTGPQGPQGAQGAAGPPGPQGPQGAQGGTGFTGSIGAQGPQGAQGAQGVAGPPGPQGPQGVAGPPGPQGPQGGTGFTGSVGAQGPQGAQGAAGPPGPQGPQGGVGFVGSRGATGFTGSVGAQGPQGIAGPPGPQGPQGVAGGPGPQGPTGFTGSGYGTTASVQMGSLGVGTTPSGTSGEIRATNNITAYFSDDRLKDRIGNIVGALDKVLSLNGFYYEANHIAQALGYIKQKEVGVSAQEVQIVLPEIVVPAPIDGKYWTVRYEKIIPLLIEAIKEQQQHINKIEEKIRGL